MSLRSPISGETLVAQDEFSGSNGTNLESHSTDDGNGYSWTNRQFDNTVVGAAFEHDRNMQLDGSNGVSPVWTSLSASSRYHSNYSLNGVAGLLNNLVTDQRYTIECDIKFPTLLAVQDWIKAGIYLSPTVTNENDNYDFFNHSYLKFQQDNPGGNEDFGYDGSAAHGSGTSIVNISELFTADSLVAGQTYRLRIEITINSGNSSLMDFHVYLDGNKTSSPDSFYTDVEFTQSGVTYNWGNISELGLFAVVNTDGSGHYSSYAPVFSNLQVFKGGVLPSAATTVSGSSIPFEFESNNGGCFKNGFADIFDDADNTVLDQHNPDVGIIWTHPVSSPNPQIVNNVLTNADISGYMQPSFDIETDLRISEIRLQFEVKARTITGSSDKGFRLILCNTIPSEGDVSNPQHRIDIGTVVDDFNNHFLAIVYYKDDTVLRTRLAELPATIGNSVNIGIILRPSGAFVLVDGFGYDNTVTSVFDSVLYESGNPSIFTIYNENIYGDTFKSSITYNQLLLNLQSICAFNMDSVGSPLGVNSAVSFDDDAIVNAIKVTLSESETTTDFLIGTEGEQADSPDGPFTPITNTGSSPGPQGIYTLLPQKPPAFQGASSNVNSGPGFGQSGPAPADQGEQQGPPSSSENPNTSIQNPANVYDPPIIIYGSA